MERAKSFRVGRERPSASLDAPPRLVDLDVEQDREGPVRKRTPRDLRSDRSAAELEHDQLRAREQIGGGLLLESAKLCLAARREDLRDRAARSFLDDGVEADEAPPEALRDDRAKRRLACAHEADESEMAVEGVQRRHVSAIRSR